MAYPPKHHQEDDYQNIIRLMETCPLATLISADEQEVLVTHLPLMFHPNEKWGTLVGHIDKFNPQLKHFSAEKEITILFNGPETYISPSVYATTQLPTWNYIKAHLKGKIQLEKKPSKLKEMLIDMTEKLEGKSPNYILEKDNPRMQKALDYIVGFTIEIITWEGKYKLSQDKRKDDQERAKERLIKENVNMKTTIENLYKGHRTKTS